MERQAPTMDSGARRALLRICRAIAYVGCAALVAMMMVVVTSVVGAQLGSPILGDTEIVDHLTGVAVFCFLPLCHLQGGNVVVDFFMRPFPERVKHWTDMVMNVAFAVVAGVLSWRLMAGGISAYARDQRSMFLELSEWPVYAIGSVVSVLWIVVILFIAYESAVRALTRSHQDPGAVGFG